MSRDDAIASVREALKNYEVGQQGIDGGGFQIKTDKDGYFYAIFESLRNGYNDDLELAVVDGNYLKFRSSSRVGYLDFAVNAKRLNYIAGQLRKKGWAAPDITPQTHPSYWLQNAPKSDQVPPSTAFRR